MGPVPVEFGKFKKSRQSSKAKFDDNHNIGDNAIMMMALRNEEATIKYLYYSTS